MASLRDFLEELWKEGRVVFATRPAMPSEEDRAEAAELLAAAYADELLDLAGPPLPYDPRAAVWAAEWTRRACWFLVSRSEPPEELERALRLPTKAPRPPQQLAADLTLRYLPHVHRRARALDPDDPLAGRLARLFRAWPLTGVLSDVIDPPLTPLDWGGHVGLEQRYAERLVGRERPGWVPEAGRSAAAVYELVGERMARRAVGARVAVSGGIDLG